MPPSPKRNDLSIYNDRVGAWWDHSDPIFAPLHALAPARLAYIHRTDAPWDQLDVVDMGCGGGYMSEVLSRGGARVTGIDIAPGAIEAALARKNETGLPGDYQVASVDALPLPDVSQDRALCTDVLVHCPSPRDAIAEAGRVLKPGGRFYFSTINRTWLATLVMIKLGEDWLRMVYKGTHDPERFITPQEMKSHLEAAGLELEHMEGVGPVGFTLTWPPRLRFGRHPSLQVMYQGYATKLGS